MNTVNEGDIYDLGPDMGGDFIVTSIHDDMAWLEQPVYADGPEKNRAILAVTETCELVRRLVNKTLKGSDLDLMQRIKAAKERANERRKS